MYINCHSHYSLHYGTFSEKELLELAQSKEINQIALTDINNTSACLNFIRLAPKYGIRPVIGIDFRNGVRQQYVGLARNNEGFFELNQHLSFYRHQAREFPDQAPVMENAFIIYPFSELDPEKPLALRSNEYIGVSLNDLKRLPFSPFYEQQEKLVFLHSVSFRNQKDFNTHRLLRAIHHNLLLSKLPASEEGKQWELMLSNAGLQTALQDYPFLLKNTERLWQQCHIEFDFSKNRLPQNPKTYTGSREGDLQKVRELCEKGLIYRYGDEIRPEIRQRMEKELDLIDKMNFLSYFLINWDILEYARSKNYFYVGRGSGANSMVAYLMRITDVDPIELDLYFERFINLYRTNPPDFDIDFSWRDREDVTRYIFERFEHTALLATYNTFQYKGAIREVGKVLGLPKREIDTLSSRELHPEKLDTLARLTVIYSRLIHGMPNHLSVHAAGILIAERPIHYFTATDLPPKGFPTTQFDMHIAEDIGLYKFDILGQRGLAKIKEALEIIRYNRPEEPAIDIHNVAPFIKDKRVNQKVKEAKCLGCFYVESPAMRMLLKKLEVDNYLGLVAASSIIRPGVSNSGMMREYILRHQNPERIQDAHPTLLDIMPDTYGVMVYQEDVIKVAHYFADLTLGEADVLRRGMSGKYRSREEFKRVERKYFENCRQKGHPPALAREVWRQIESFAGYAFAKGHSASYAVESYQSLYLKTYYPLEFMVAVLNNGGGFYRPEIYIHEIRQLGGTVHSPCVNTSAPVTVLNGKDVFLGFHVLKDLEVHTAEAILEERIRGGAFSSLEDFIERVSIGMEQLSILIRINAFRFTGENKRKLLWEAHLRHQGGEALPEQKQLFKVASKKYRLPAFTSTHLEDAFDQIEIIGFPLSNPFHLLKDTIKRYILVKDLPRYLGQTITLYGYLVSIKNTSTKNGAAMNFGTFIDAAGDFLDTTHFPFVAANFPFRGKGVYTITGKVVVEFGYYSVEVISMEKLAYIADPRYDDSTNEEGQKQLA